MNENYKKIYFVDTENQGYVYAKDLVDLNESDLVLCMFTEFSPKFTYEYLSYFMSSKATFKFISCICGTPNALDFQLSSTLGFYLSKVDEDRKTDTEFIILSEDTGYYPMVSYWRGLGYNVNIKKSLSSEIVDVDAVLNHISDNKVKAAVKAVAQKSQTTESISNDSKVEEVTSESVDKFNARMLRSNALKLQDKETVKKIVLSDLEDTDIESDKECDKETDKTLESDKFQFLNMYSLKEIPQAIAEKLDSNISADIVLNAKKVVSYLKVSKELSMAISYIIYFSSNTVEMRDKLLQFMTTDKKVNYTNTLLKRYEQGHFKRFES